MTDFNAQIDDQVPAGTQGTITMPVTGHVLSAPQAERGESFASYAWRVHRQCGWPDAADCRGELMFDSTAICDAAGGWTADGKNWPLAADMFFDHDAYLNPAQKAQLAQAQAAWAAAEAKIGQSTQSASNTASRMSNRPHGKKHSGATDPANQPATPAPQPTPPAPADGPPVAQG